MMRSNWRTRLYMLQNLQHLTKWSCALEYGMKLNILKSGCVGFFMYCSACVELMILASLSLFAWFRSLHAVCLALPRLCKAHDYNRDDHGSTDNTTAILQPYIDAGMVSLTHTAAGTTIAESEFAARYHCLDGSVVKNEDMDVSACSYHRIANILIMRISVGYPNRRGRDASPLPNAHTTSFQTSSHLPNPRRIHNPSYALTFRDCQSHFSACLASRSRRLFHRTTYYRLSW